MVSLIDIAPQQKTVPICDVDIAVFGVSAEGIAQLLIAFPELRQMMGGKAKASEVTAETIMSVAPRAVAAAIAAGTGHPGDPAHEAAASKLAIGDQLDLLSAIFDMTFPKGLDPFVAKLEALGIMGRAPAALGTGADTKSPAPSNT